MTVYRKLDEVPCSGVWMPQGEPDEGVYLEEGDEFPPDHKRWVWADEYHYGQPPPLDGEDDE